MPTFFLYDVFVQHDVDLWDDDGEGIDGSDQEDAGGHQPQVTWPWPFKGKVQVGGCTSGN